MTLTASQVRQQFIDFFVERAGHTFVPASPSVPLDDPTLLFTNAGMNQFKPLFLGQARPGTPLAALKRAANSQKCIRAGGKHNDLDDVGKDTYHHTFFEMLGNWSFGDYFKAEAIQWAWELLTQIWGLDPNRLYASYFEGKKELGLEPDREAYDLWRRYLPAERIIPGNMKDNFWEMGDTGPCGPCSEIHFDGRTDAERRARGGDTLVNTGDPNVVEIWNLVFIQFNRVPGGALQPLPAKHVDTGMGLERVVRFIQGKSSNYDTDVFAPLFAAIKRVCNAPDYRGTLESPTDIAYRVLADHARTLTIAITDGAEPSNEGRGYVLRRILRRAVRYGRQTLGVPGAFLHQLVPTVVESLSGAFPELKKNPQRVIDIIKDEEEAFGRTLSNGLALFEKAAVAAAGTRVFPADESFRLHDTYGFPFDLTQLMAMERGLSVDEPGFLRLMEEAREKARAGGKGAADHALALTGDAIARLRAMKVDPTEDADKFHGRKIRARIVAIWNGDNFDESVTAANTRATDRFGVILDVTNFYAEMGGQMADHGRIVDLRSGAVAGGEFGVEDVQNFGGYVLHVGRVLKGEIRVGEEVELRLDAQRRRQIASNHTCTHLLNHALRQTLGDHIDQKGSLVAPDRLRFDYSHTAPLSSEEARRIEAQVVAAINANLEVFAQITPLEQARRINGLRAVFGETYPDPVRTVSIGVAPSALLADPANARWRAHSVEFCGGTHLARTGEAGAFALLSEEGVAKGVRRITALTEEAARHAIALADRLAVRLSGAEKLPDLHLPGEVAALSTEIESAPIPLTHKADLRARLLPLVERVKQIQKAGASADRERAVAEARRIADNEDGPVIVARLDAGPSREALLAALDCIRARHAGAAVMLISVEEAEGKVSIVAGVPEAIIKKGLKAGDWVREAAAACGGKGGGRPDAAQGGGTEPAKARDAVNAARAYAAGKA